MCQGKRYQTYFLVLEILVYWCVRAKSLLSCLTLCSPVDCSLPGPSVHGILQARILEWVAMLSSRGSSLLGIELASLTSPALVASFFFFFLNFFYH